MEVDAIVAECHSLILDSSYTTDWYIGKLNAGLQEIATSCRIPGLIVTVPLTLLANSESVALPRNYLHDLFFVSTPSHPRGLPIRANYMELKKVSTTSGGNINKVAIEHKTMYYNPSPTVEEIAMCSFYSAPAELVAGDTIPTYITETAQRNILQNYILKEAYLKIEDGIDGAAVNTVKFTKLFNDGVIAIQAFYPNAPKQVITYDRKVNWF